MFARSSLCVAAPLRQSFRAYSSQVTQPKSTAIPWIVAVGAVVSGTLGYTYLGNARTAHADAPSKPEKKAFTGGDQGFISLKLKEIKPYNHDTKHFVFALPEDDMLSGLPVTSAVLTKVKKEGDEKPTTRPYTPVSDESSPGHMDLLIKVYPEGVMSKHIHSMKEGDTLDIKGPLPKYPWSANKHSSIALIAGGAGITPMYQLIRAIFGNPSDQTRVSLIFGNKTESDILLREEFEELRSKYPDRFSLHYLLDSPSKGWQGGKGYVTKELIQDTCPGPKEENIKIFVCGPPPLYKAVSGPKKSPQDQGELDGALKELGYSKEQVYKF